MTVISVPAGSLRYTYGCDDKTGKLFIENADYTEEMTVDVITGNVPDGTPTPFWRIAPWITLEEYVSLEHWENTPNGPMMKVLIRLPKSLEPKPVEMIPFDIILRQSDTPPALTPLDVLRQSGPVTAEGIEMSIAILHKAGCKCEKPLLGWRPNVGPRCRICNTVAEIWQE